MAFSSFIFLAIDFPDFGKEPREDFEIFGKHARGRFLPDKIFVEDPTGVIDELLDVILLWLMADGVRKSFGVVDNIDVDWTCVGICGWLLVTECFSINTDDKGLEGVVSSDIFVFPCTLGKCKDKLWLELVLLLLAGGFCEWDDECFDRFRDTYDLCEFRFDWTRDIPFFLDPWFGCTRLDRDFGTI